MSNKEKPAHPIITTNISGQYANYGLTKREYAAIQILAGTKIINPCEERIKLAVKCADKLFEELEK